MWMPQHERLTRKENRGIGTALPIGSGGAPSLESKMQSAAFQLVAFGSERNKELLADDQEIKNLGKDHVSLLFRGS